MFPEQQMVLKDCIRVSPIKHKTTIIERNKKKNLAELDLNNHQLTQTVALSYEKKYKYRHGYQYLSRVEEETSWVKGE